MYYINLQFISFLKNGVLCILYKKIKTNVWAVSYTPRLILKNCKKYTLSCNLNVFHFNKSILKYNFSEILSRIYLLLKK